MMGQTMKTTACLAAVILLLAACGETDTAAGTTPAASPPMQASDAHLTPAAASAVPTAENSKIAENFCYAVHASGNCPELSMRLDTREKVEAMVGSELGTPQSLYAEACMTGLSKATEDKQLCRNAWARFGCGGSVMPNLLQQNPSDKTQQPVLCKFS